MKINIQLKSLIMVFIIKSRFPVLALLFYYNNYSIKYIGRVLMKINLFNYHGQEQY